MSWTSSFVTFSGLSVLWTLFLWAVSRWLVKGVYSVSPFALPILVSLFSITALYHALSNNLPYLGSYFFFFSALIITLFTDATTLLISRYVTIYAMPIGWLLSNMELLPITPLESVGGSLAGLLILATVRYVSKKLLGKDGLGQGDVDLLCFIGAFTGPSGCWITLMTGSLLGSLFGIIYFIAAKGRRDILLPFGLFLGMGAILYVLFQKQLTSFFLPLY
jgi:leader peptidase (prepilin peptidase)/N-methyltransferase